jgi:dCTP deaminase
MLLQREALLEAMQEPDLSKRLVVTPILDAARQIGAGSIDLRLGSGFIEVRRRGAYVIDPFDPSPVSDALTQERYAIPIGESFFLHPGQFLLGASFEFVRLPAHIGGQVLGRSSWGRLGLIVATAVTVQPGYGGSLTLEIQNLGSVPIKLFPGLRVAQLMLWETKAPTGTPYAQGAKYGAPLGPENSRIGWERAEVDRLRSIGKSLRGANRNPPAVGNAYS